MRAAVALIAATALAVPALGAATAGAATTVTLGDNFFAPSSKTVSAGTKVRFNWTGSNRHNVRKARGPGAPFISRTTSADGVNFAKRFAKRGVYRLVCTIHPAEMRMRLTVK